MYNSDQLLKEIAELIKLISADIKEQLNYYNNFEVKSISDQAIEKFKEAYNLKFNFENIPSVDFVEISLNNALSYFPEMTYSSRSVKKLVTEFKFTGVYYVKSSFFKTCIQNIVPENFLLSSGDLTIYVLGKAKDLDIEKLKNDLHNFKEKVRTLNDEIQSVITNETAKLNSQLEVIIAEEEEKKEISNKFK